MNVDNIKNILKSKRDLNNTLELPDKLSSMEAEGGCGVTGFACTIPVRGRNIYEPSIQMRNRGNGKGGGIAACGLMPEDFGVSRKVLTDYFWVEVGVV